MAHAFPRDLSPERRSRMRRRINVLEAAAALTGALLAVRFAFSCIAPWAMKPGVPNLKPAPLQVKEEVRRAVLTAARRLPWKTLCLPRAVAAKWLLQRRGYSSTIQLGVGTRDARLHAHAWLSIDGETLIGGAEAAGLEPILNRPTSRT